MACASDAAQEIRALGDMDPEAFRREAHRIADWIADYFSNPERFPVMSRGAARRNPRRAARPRRRSRARPSTRSSPISSASCCPASPTGIIPNFFAYFAITGSAPGVLAEFLSAALNVQAMLWRTSPAATELEEVVLGWLRQLIGLPGFLRRGDLRHRVDFDPARARGRARAGRRRRADTRPRGPFRSAALPRLLLGARALVDRQGGHPARARPRRRCAASKPTTEFRMRPEALAAAIAEDTRAGSLPIAVVATVGTTSTTSVDPVGAIAAICAREKLWLHVDAAYAGVAAMVPESSWILQGAPTRRLARRQPAQVAVHAVRSERAVLPPNGCRARRVLADAGVPEDGRGEPPSGT